MASTTVAARIAALVRKHAPPNAKIEGLDKEVEAIGAAAIASAYGVGAAVASAAVTLEWFKLANRAEIKLSADTTTDLAHALVAHRSRRVVLLFTDPDMVVGEVPARPVAETAVQLDLEDAKVIDPNEEMTGASREVVDPKTGEITVEQAKAKDVSEAAEPRRLTPRGAKADDTTVDGAKPLADGEMPELPKALRRGKNAEPKPTPQAKAKPAETEQWVSSVDEPDSEDAGAP